MTRAAMGLNAFLVPWLGLPPDPWGSCRPRPPVLTMRPFDVRVLRTFVATGEQQDDHGPTAHDPPSKARAARVPARSGDHRRSAVP